MATSSTVTFSGMSTYASDFQQVLQRAVDIASLPITQYNDNLTQLNSEVAEYQVLDADTINLKTAIQQLGTAITTSYTVNSSDSDVASGSVSTGVMAGTYTIDVTDTGAYSQYMSTSALSNTASAGTYTLTVDGKDYTINPSGTTIEDLASAINASGAPVSASAVNMGSSSSTDYRLSLQSTTLSAMTVSLDAGSGDVLQQIGDAGRPATYIVNNQTADPITSDSSNVQLAPGLTVSLTGTGTTTITVSTSNSGVSQAMEAIVSAYNSLMSELATNRGQSTGALKGASQIGAVETAVRQLMTYRDASGNVQSLINLGLSLDQNGVASFDSNALNNVSFQDMQAFLGDGTSSGFLAQATSVLDNLDTGVLTDSVSSLKDEITQTNDQIDAVQNRVDTLQTSLTAQLSAADSTIYGLQQQASYFQNLFEAMQTNEKSLAG